jgi:hypothetical protein
VVGLGYTLGLLLNQSTRENQRHVEAIEGQQDAV